MRVGSAAAASLLHPHAAAVLGPPALAALLRPQIFPISSVVAPCQPGASAPSVRRRIYETDHLAAARRPPGHEDSLADGSSLDALRRSFVTSPPEKTKAGPALRPILPSPVMTVRSML